MYKITNNSEFYGQPICLHVSTRVLTIKFYFLLLKVTGKLDELSCCYMFDTLVIILLSLWLVTCTCTHSLSRQTLQSEQWGRVWRDRL